MLRRRGDNAGGNNSSDGEDNKPSIRRKQIFEAVRSLDVYSNDKVAREFVETSPVAESHSRNLTYGVYVVSFLLMLSELAEYRRVVEKDHLTVDKSLGQKLRISLNVTFPALNCAEVHLDAMDVAGDYHPYMEQHMLKQRLGLDGLPIVHEEIRETANVYEHDAESLVPVCDSCFGAESPARPCCNSCEDLRAAYDEKSWASTEVTKKAPQCAKMRASGPWRNVEKGEGCNLAGWLEVNKVGGNFHVALGESSVRDGRFVHQFNPTDAPKFDVSHTVNHLSFGDEYSGMILPMNGLERRVDPQIGTGLYQYFIKLVPTIYKSSETTLNTTRYSFTHRFRPLRPPTEEAEPEDHLHHAKLHSPTAILPGVFFVYDLSAFMVEVTRHRPVSFSHFLVRVCAILGGVVTVVRGLDAGASLLKSLATSSSRSS